jgi:hypothetical protein
VAGGLALLAALLVAGVCLRRPPSETKNTQAPPEDVKADAKREQEIRSLIEQLVFAKRTASNAPVYSPGVENDSKEYRERFEACQKAFQKLAEFRGLAFPFLIEHLEDKRQSMPFRNHYLGASVGDACYWNIYFQLQDRPEDYSEYGYMRKGRDGKDHPKPYWEGTPFDDAGGLVKWLDANKALSYVEKQVKCLRWLLEKEKAIGACDAESYFVNILPLEIRILERRLEAGEDVKKQLEDLRRIKEKKLADKIPAELLPAR